MLSAGGGVGDTVRLVGCQVLVETLAAKGQLVFHFGAGSAKANESEEIKKIRSVLDFMGLVDKNGFCEGV